MWILCVYAKTSKTSFGRRSLRDLCVCAHMCWNTNSLLSRIRILKTNCNHHYNDHSNYEFSLVCNHSSFRNTRQHVQYTRILITTSSCSTQSCLKNLWWKKFLFHQYSRLRSLSQSLDVQPKVASKTSGERSFSFLSPSLWNTLPTWMWTLPTVTSFRKHLKTCDTFIIKRQ